MTTEVILKICKDRNEIDFLFQLTKTVAEADSIGECWSYCGEYDKERFNNAEKNEGGLYCEYIEHCSADLYRLYLIQIGVLPKQ